MTKILLTSALLLLSISLFACTFIPETFCKSINIKSEYHVVTGRIISVDYQGLDLEVVEILRGEESKTVIRIWDGTDFDCNGNWSMSCETIGSLGDTVIISLPKIVDIENEWDVVGDYRRPDPYSFTSTLKLNNGIAKGLIKGDAISPPEYNLLELDYETLKDSIILQGECGTLSDIEDTSLFAGMTYTNPIFSLLELKNINSSKIKEINIYSFTGERIRSKRVHNSFDLQLEFYHEFSGTYVLELVSYEGKRESVKLTKL